MNARTMETLEKRLHLDAGEIDALFGTNGTATIAFPGGTAEVVDVAVRSDGTVYVAATVAPIQGVRRFGVARYRSDGTLDTTFGIDGWATSRVGSVDSIAADMALQPDGRIVVLGTSVNPPQDPPHFTETIDVVQVPIDDERNFAVARFRTDGSLDRTFGRRGIARVDVGEVGDFSAPIQVDSFASDEGQRIEVQPDGKLLLAGLGALAELVGTSQGPDVIVETQLFSLARLNGNGTLDASFGPDGNGINVVGGDELDAVGLDSQGRLLVVGSNSFTTIGGDEQTSRSIRRFTSDGLLDDTYDGLDQSDEGIFTDGAVQADDKVLARFFDELLRFNADGSPDTGFDPDTTTGVFAPDRDGKIIFFSAKLSPILPATPVLFPTLRRALSDGSPDSTFGSGGEVENPPGFPGFGAARIVVNSDGSYTGLGGFTGFAGESGLLMRFFRDDGPAVLLKVKGITAPQTDSQVLTVTYRDDDAIDLGTLDNRDLRVTGPNGFVRYAKFAVILNNSDPRQVTVRYKLPAPGGSWDPSDDGIYTVRLRTDQVADENGNFASTPTLGSFRVAIPLVGVVPQSVKPQNAGPPRSNPQERESDDDTHAIDLINT